MLSRNAQPKQEAISSAPARARAGRGAPGRKRVPRATRERQMVSAAAKVFAQRGFSGASMEEIAARAGVTKPMLYAYFDSKEGLFGSCAVTAGARLRERVRAAAARPGLGLDERLWAGFQEVFAFVDENRDAWRLLYPAGSLASGSR